MKERVIFGERGDLIELVDTVEKWSPVSSFSSFDPDAAK